MLHLIRLAQMTSFSVTQQIFRSLTAQAIHGSHRLAELQMCGWEAFVGIESELKSVGRTVQYKEVHMYLYNRAAKIIAVLL